MSSKPVKKPHLKIPKNKLRHRSEFLCDPTFTNELPTVPIEAKFVQLYNKPSSIELSKYNIETGPSLAATKKVELHPEYERGIRLNFVDPTPFTNIDETAELHPDDEDLLYDEKSTSDGPIIPQHAWLRSTEYFSTDYDPSLVVISAGLEQGVDDDENAQTMTRKEVQAAIRKKTATYVAKDTRDPTEVAQESFEQAERLRANGFVHPTNPNIKPKNTWQFLPHSQTGIVELTTVMFEDDPSPTTGTEDEKAALARRLIFRSTDANAGIVYAPMGVETQQHYKWLSDYGYSVHNKTSATPGARVPTNLVISADDDGSIGYLDVGAQQIRMKKEIKNIKNTERAQFIRRPYEESELESITARVMQLDCEDSLARWGALAEMYANEEIILEEQPIEEIIEEEAVEESKIGDEDEEEDLMMTMDSQAEIDGQRAEMEAESEKDSEEDELFGSDSDDDDDI